MNTGSPETAAKRRFCHTIKWKIKTIFYFDLKNLARRMNGVMFFL